MIPDIKSLSQEEKFLTMKNLWEDMRDQIAKTPATPEIISLLEERFKRVQSGEAQLLDWDEVKGSIGRR